MRFLMLAALLCAAPAHAETNVPCDDLEAMMRLVGVSIDGMQAFSTACADDPSAAPCMAFNTALLQSKHAPQEDDPVKLGRFEGWVRTECPEMANFLAN